MSRNRDEGIRGRGSRVQGGSHEDSAPRGERRRASDQRHQRPAPPRDRDGGRWRGGRRIRDASRKWRRRSEEEEALSSSRVADLLGHEGLVEGGIGLCDDGSNGSGRHRLHDTLFSLCWNDDGKQLVCHRQPVCLELTGRALLFLRTCVLLYRRRGIPCDRSGSRDAFDGDGDRPRHLSALSAVLRDRFADRVPPHLVAAWTCSRRARV